MITITAISTVVTLLSIIVAVTGLLSKRRNRKSFDEYSHSVDQLTAYLSRAGEEANSSHQEEAKYLILDVKRLVYYANLYSLKTNMVKQALMWLWENGDREDVDAIRRAADYGYIRGKANRTLAKFVMENLASKSPKRPTFRLWNSQ